MTTVNMLDWLYAPAQFMAGRPERALAVAACFAIAAVVLRIAKRRVSALTERPVILCTALWVFWGINEHAAKLYGWNIRVDIVFLWPILAIVTLACIGLTLASIRAAVRGSETHGAAPRDGAVYPRDPKDTKGH